MFAKRHHRCRRHPGIPTPEMMLDNFGVTEATWRDAIDKATGFSESETPYFVGRCIAALAADPAVAEKSGGVYSSWDLAEEYGVDDIDGRRPHWGRYVETSLSTIIDKGGPSDDAETYWATAWYRTLRDEPATRNSWRGSVASCASISFGQTNGSASGTHFRRQSAGSRRRGSTRRRLDRHGSRRRLDPLSGVGRPQRTDRR